MRPAQTQVYNDSRVSFFPVKLNLPFLVARFFGGVTCTAVFFYFFVTAAAFYTSLTTHKYERYISPFCCHLNVPYTFTISLVCYFLAGTALHQRAVIEAMQAGFALDQRLTPPPGKNLVYSIRWV